MKRNLLYYSLSFLVVLSSCSLLYEYREIEEIPDWSWDGDKVYTFTYEASEAKDLNATMIFRHVYGFRHSEVSIACEINSPNGTMDTVFVVPFKDEQGDYVGEGSVDLWDLNFMFLESHPFEAGKHTFQFSQQTADPLQLMMEVGLKLEVPKD